MQLSKKPKTFYQYLTGFPESASNFQYMEKEVKVLNKRNSFLIFIAFLESTSNSNYFEKRDEVHSSTTSDIIDSK